MKVEEKKLIKEKINFLASGKYTAFTYTVSKSKGEVIENRKIVKAGTILPENDNTAIGILLEDVDVTNGDALGSLIEEGFIFKDKLPVVPDERAIEKLKKITFK